MVQDTQMNPLMPKPKKKANVTITHTNPIAKMPVARALIRLRAILNNTEDDWRHGGLVSGRQHCFGRRLQVLAKKQLFTEPHPFYLIGKADNIVKIVSISIIITTSNLNVALSRTATAVRTYIEPNVMSRIGKYLKTPASPRQQNESWPHLLHSLQAGAECSE